MENKRFETESFAMPTSRYVGIVMTRLLAHWWWIPTVFIAGCAALAAIVNINFIFVALMIVFIIIPTALMFTYLYYSTTTEARIAILSKKIVFDNHSITVIFDEITSQDDNGDTIKNVTPSPITLDINEIKRVDDMGKHIVIHLKGNHYRFISIPLNVMKGDVTDFLAYILQ